MSYELEGKKPRTILVGNRIPKQFFITQGTGESNLAIHAGSYHLALRQAGIERCNIMEYSSILPKIAEEVKKDPKTIDSLVHGAVMDTIMANATAEKGQRATAGIIFGWLNDKKTGERYGGLVCEYKGHDEVKTIKELLSENLAELYSNGYSEEFRLEQGRLITKSFIPKKKYGTALVALCFLNYELPVLKDSEGALQGTNALLLESTR
jgi:arginine decarboxylase